jgi:hypothetical protein
VNRVVLFVLFPLFGQAYPFYGILVQGYKSDVKIRELSLFLCVREDHKLAVIVNGVTHTIKMERYEKVAPVNLIPPLQADFDEFALGRARNMRTTVFANTSISPDRFSAIGALLHHLHVMSPSRKNIVA